MKNGKKINKKINKKTLVMMILISLFLGFMFVVRRNIYSDQDYLATLSSFYTHGLVRFSKNMILLLIIATYFLVVQLFLIRIDLFNFTGDNRLTKFFSQIVNWIFSSWQRIFLVLLIVWSLLLIPFFPATAGYDYANQVFEFFGQHYRDGGVMPLDIYPIGRYLITSASTWTNQHGAFLTLIYGSIARASINLFASFLPATALLALSQFLLTILSYTYAFNTLGQVIKSNFLRGLAYFLVLFNPIIILSSISLVKNPLFCAGFIISLSVIFKLIFAIKLKKREWLLFLIANLIQLISVKWAIYLLVVELIMAIIIWHKKYFKQFLMTLFCPILIFQIALQILFATGTVIKDDPIERKNLPIQQVARYVKKYPQDLSLRQRVALAKIFQIDNMARVYNPYLADPVKSSGGEKFYDERLISYDWRNVKLKEKDWRDFNRIYVELGLHHPVVYLDHFLDFFSNCFTFSDHNPHSLDIRGIIWEEEIAGIGNICPKGYNDEKRIKAEKIYLKLSRMVIFQGNFWLIMVILLFVPIVFKIRKLLILYLPLLLQIGVLIVSPLAGSIRYKLGFIYAVPLFLVIFIYFIRNFQQRKELGG